MKSEATATDGASAAIEARRIVFRRLTVAGSVIRRQFRRSLVDFARPYLPVATTWRLYDGSVLGGRPLIAHGTRSDAPVIADNRKWAEIRKRIEEMA